MSQEQAKEGTKTSQKSESWKVVFLGAADVGKTSIINRFMYGTFRAECEATLGIDFFTKTVTQGNVNIILQMWDTAGQEKFQSLIPSYIRDTKLAILVYNVNDAKTFEEVKTWKNRVEQQNGDETGFLLVGNKTDLEEVVSSQEVENYAKSCNIPVTFCSAKTGEGIDDIFNKLVQTQKIVQPQNVITPQKTENKSGQTSKTEGQTEKPKQANTPETVQQADNNSPRTVQLKPTDSQEQQNKSSGCC